MKNSKFSVLSGVACVLAVALVGCDTAGKTGALAGGGIGALAGQAIGGNTEATLVGAAVGTGIGYVIGNEKDKKHAKEMSEQSKSKNYTHNEVGSLGGTRWLVKSVAPKQDGPEYSSKIVEFRPNGRVITTTTNPDGKVDVSDESYRVVDDTLVVNAPNVLINARYAVSGDQLIVSADEFRAVLERMR